MRDYFNYFRERAARGARCSTFCRVLLVTILPRGLRDRRAAIAKYAAY
jgi:hypothetical protein